MVIREIVAISPNDLVAHCWGELQRFHNLGFVTDFLMDLHQIPASQASNARKQAAQIRYCLKQAKEYAEAASTVSLITKPVLQYYSLMSLALAEILLKQSGDSSLDKAREHHRHHGLELKIDRLPRTSDTIETSALGLRATPSVRGDGSRFGTFELWHRSCREMPAGGEWTRYFGSTASSSGVQNFMSGTDAAMNDVPVAGLSLLDCLVSLPAFLEFCNEYGLRSRVIRGKLKMARRDSNIEHTLILHPARAELINEFLENCKFDPKSIDQIELEVLPSGAIAHWQFDISFGPVRCSLPHGSMWRSNEIRFWPGIEPLNEFGYFYVAAHIAGNYARYFPDRWVADVEASTPLAAAMEALTLHIERRVPLLALSEMRRKSYVLNAS